MARTKRAQVLMEPEEYARLEEIAARKGIPVAELIRDAVRERYLTSTADRQRLVEEIVTMDLPTQDWAISEQEIALAHDACLP